MDGEGMVAVVRGLRDAGLAVTLLDAGRQYTLLPDNASQPVTVSLSQSAGSQCSGETRRESGVQATDGRYASTYKMMHCNVTPTSPPDQVTEFPPQRSEICPGAVCSPRPSLQADTFANSLRKYPSLTQDRSSEIVERLINFTQTKNCSRMKPMTSPLHDIESEASTHTHTSRKHRYEPDINLRHRRIEESPTKERARKILVEQETVEPWRKSTFSKTSDVRYLRDMSRKVREGIRSLSATPNVESEHLTRDIIPSSDMRRSINKCNTNSVNMEIQAAVQMVSQEVVTVPRAVPSQRTVAVPLTSTSSLAARRSEGSVSCSRNILDLYKMKHDTEASRRQLDPLDMNIQTVSSAIEVSNHRCRHRKRSKSQEELSLNEQMKHEILDLMLPLYTCCAKTKPHKKSQGKSNKNNNMTLKLYEDKHSCKSRERRPDCGFETTHSKYKKRLLARIFHAEVSPYRMTNDDDLIVLLEDWINLIPLKRTGCFSTSDYRESLFYDLFGCLKYAVYNCKGIDERCKLKSEIINSLESVQLDVKRNRRAFENRLADILVNKIKRLRRKQTNQLPLDENTVEDTKSFRLKSKKFKTPSESELRNFILHELLMFLKRTDLKLNQNQIKELQDELKETLIVSIELLCCANDTNLNLNLTDLLLDYGISEHQAIFFTNTLIRHFRNIFMNDMRPGKIRSETFIVLSNTQNVQANGNATANSFSIRSINEDDIQANLEYYTNDLCHQIDEWLAQLPMTIPQERAFRQVVINDLAGDIVDRLRYVELNPNSKGSDEEELEHLKYQIFKWINKLVGEDNLEITKYAPDLMRRIKDIPVPMLSKMLNADINDMRASSAIQFTSIPPYDKSLPGNQVPNDCNTSSNAGQNLGSDITNQIEKTLKDLQDEYAQFVKDWVKLIPIEANTDEELAVAEKARLGLHNGLWKVVTKLDCDPATYYNRFFYEDLLDDGIDDLLDCLPQTPELLSKKHLLKVRFIQKTTDIHDLIKANEEASYKHNLIKNIFNSLRQQGLANMRCDDPEKVHQEMQIKKIVEEFLLCTSFKDDDKVKAEVYKKKLLKHIEDFIEDLKQHHPQELKDVDISSYKTDIVNILLKVRLPSDEIIKQEADSILLGLEIEQWYDDLPVVQSDDYKDQYQRSKQREMLANKVKDFEKDNSNLCCLNALKLEVSKFLEKTPLIEGANLNIHFMADQFVNRMKNRPKKENANNEPFQTIPDYKDFSKEVSFCSSFVNAQKAKTEVLGPIHDSSAAKQCTKSCSGQVPNASINISNNNVSSRIQSNRSRVIIQEPPTYRTFNEGRPLSSSFHENENSPQWLTLEESQPNVQNVQNIKNIQNEHMVTIPPYSSPEHVTSQRNEQNISLQRPDERLTINRTIINENKTCCSEKADSRYVSENEQKPSNREHLYPRKGEEDNRYSDKIKSSRGVLGTSQIAGPSGYSSKNSQNVNGIRFRPNKYEMKGPCQVSQDSNISKTQIEQPSPDIDECSIACQTNNINQPELRIYDNVGNMEGNQMNVSTNTMTNVPGGGQQMYSYTPRQEIGPSVLSCPSRRGARPQMYDENGVRRRTGGFDEEDDGSPCRCNENYWRRPKRYPCEALENFSPCVPLWFPYPYFF